MLKQQLTVLKQELMEKYKLLNEFNSNLYQGWRI